MASCHFFLFCLFVLFALGNAGGDLGRGFGDKYDWHTLEEGLKTAEESQKPMMVVIHKSWCGACKRLGPLFANSEEILNLSKEFVLVNIQDDEEPADVLYKPDGGYIPRILFLDPQGHIRGDIINSNGNPKYKFFYSEPSQIIKSMQKALSVIKSNEKNEL